MLPKKVPYQDLVCALKTSKPNIIASDIGAVGELLRDYRWCVADIQRVLPASREWLGRGVYSSLPFVFVNREVRDAFPEAFRSMSIEARNAKHLYNPRDLLAWCRENFESTVDTVLIPLTMLSDRPDEMRAAFRAAVQKRMIEGTRPKRSPRLSSDRVAEWPEIVRLIRREHLSLLGSYIPDVDAHRKSTDEERALVDLPKYVVRLPEDKLPRFLKRLVDVAATRNYRSINVARSTVRIFGWIKHAAKSETPLKSIGYDSSVTLEQTFYTPGLWFGGDACIEDYENGLVELLTAERFVQTFGLEALLTADWRFPRELCEWSAPDARFGPGAPPKNQAFLLGFNRNGRCA